MTIYFIAALVLLIIAFITKLIFWINIPQRRTKSFFLSFIRWYSVYDIHDATSDESKKFREKSNLLSFLFWLAFIVIALVLLSLNQQVPIKTIDDNVF